MKIQTSIQIPEDLWVEAKKRYVKRRITLSRLVEEALRNYLKADGGRRCPECGREIPEDTKVCPYCGIDLKAPKFELPGL